MNYNTCSNNIVLFVLGLIVFLVSSFFFVRYGWIERTRGLTPSAYFKLGIIGWILNTISISILGLGGFGLDESGCHLSESVGFFLTLLCPSILSIVVTLSLLTTVWTERVRRMAKEQEKMSNCVRKS